MGYVIEYEGDDTFRLEDFMRTLDAFEWQITLTYYTYDEEANEGSERTVETRFKGLSAPQNEDKTENPDLCGIFELLEENLQGTGVTLNIPLHAITRINL